MPWVEIGALLILAMLVLGVRLVGARRLRSGDRRAIWPIYLPTIVLFAIPVIALPSLMSSAPMIGIVFGIGRGLVLFVAVRGVWRASRSTRPITNADEAVDAVIEPMYDLVVVATVVMLALGLFGGIALVVRAILARA
jgi:hypothetical protein